MCITVIEYVNYCSLLCRIQTPGALTLQGIFNTERSHCCTVHVEMEGNVRYDLARRSACGAVVCERETVTLRSWGARFGVIVVAVATHAR